MTIRRLTFALLTAFCWQVSASAQVTYERLLNAGKESGNWMTYSGSYRSWRYSSLDQITRDNGARLKVEWVYQMPTTLMVETTPLVVDGIMYVTEPPSNVSENLTEPPSTVVALDAATGRRYWRYQREL